MATCLLLLLFAAGCGQPKSMVVEVAGPVTSQFLSDADKVAKADLSILFVGNSHTSYHDLPRLVCEMIRFRQPKKVVFWHQVVVTFLEDVAGASTCRSEIETRPWKFVVLQAQKISESGKYNYSRSEGIDVAKLARTRGMTALFFAEWGRKGVVGDGARQFQIYREMAREAGVGVAPVPRAWDLALADRPDLPLHDVDGNHQTALGAFLTACVLVGRITGESPAPLADYPYPAAEEKDREFLAGMAAKVTAEKVGDEAPSEPLLKP